MTTVATISSPSFPPVTSQRTQAPADLWLDRTVETIKSMEKEKGRNLLSRIVIVPIAKRILGATIPLTALAELCFTTVVSLPIQIVKRATGFEGSPFQEMCRIAQLISMTILSSLLFPFALLVSPSRFYPISYGPPTEKGELPSLPAPAHNSPVSSSASSDLPSPVSRPISIETAKKAGNSVSNSDQATQKLKESFEKLIKYRQRCPAEVSVSLGELEQPILEANKTLEETGQGLRFELEGYGTEDCWEQDCVLSIASPYLNDELLAALLPRIVATCPNLAGLSIRKCPQVTGEGLIQALAQIDEVQGKKCQWKWLDLGIMKDLPLSRLGLKLEQVFSNRLRFVGVKTKHLPINYKDSEELRYFRKKYITSSLKEAKCELRNLKSNLQELFDNFTKFEAIWKEGIEGLGNFIFNTSNDDLTKNSPAIQTQRIGQVIEDLQSRIKNKKRSSKDSLPRPDHYPKQFIEMAARLTSSYQTPLLQMLQERVRHCALQDCLDEKRWNKYRELFLDKETIRRYRESLFFQNLQRVVEGKLEFRAAGYLIREWDYSKRVTFTPSGFKKLIECLIAYFPSIQVLHLKACDLEATEKQPGPNHPLACLGQLKNLTDLFLDSGLNLERISPALKFLSTHERLKIWIPASVRERSAIAAQPTALDPVEATKK